MTSIPLELEFEILFLIKKNERTANLLTVEWVFFVIVLSC